MSEQTLRKIGWLGYATVYLLITLQSNLSQYYFNDSSMLLLMNSIIPVAVVYAVFGYAFDKAFMERMIWRFLFWILSLRFVFIAYININAGVVDNFYVLMLLLIPLPGLYALYRYSELENSVWVVREHKEHEKFAMELFDNKQQVKGSLDSKEGEGVACDAILKKTGQGFQLDLAISEDGQTRNESYTFDTALQALEYIEENTPLSMYELE